jgi:hypothetical protein
MELLTMCAIITVALSNHRPEIIPLAFAKMVRCETVVLEEPREANFGAMLTGDVAIDEYVMGIDTEYPSFSRAMCRSLRKLHDQGIQILQVEPYLARLTEIHERFGEGARPKELRPDSRLWPVYQMEREATQSLMTFYKAFTAGDFKRLLAAVKRFAWVDAKRFDMRDRLRAQKIAAFARSKRIYVEAGQMHVGLVSLLRQRVKGWATVTADYLVSAVLSSCARPKVLFGPGDVLTLLYIFNPRFDGEIADLLAARALVQNKLLIKDEITSDLETFPHTRDELESAHLVRKLSMEDCQRLLPIVSKLGVDQARQALAAFKRDFSA